MSPHFRPELLELERRDVPAWFSVTAPAQAEGTAGSTDTTHTGQLTFSPSDAKALA